MLIAVLSWTFFSYVDYVLNVITPESFSFDFEASAVINFIVLVSVVAIVLAIFRQKRWTLVTAGVVGLIFIALFGATYTNGIGVGMVVLLFLNARHDGVEEIDQRIKINSRMIVRRFATPIVMTLFILISFAAFQSPVAKGIAQAQQLPSAGEQLVRSIIDSVIGSQIEDSPEKENILSEVAKQTFQELNSLLKPYFQYAPPLLAFGLFLVLWGLSWFFVQLSVLAGVLIFWILKKTNFVKIVEKDVKAETLVI